MALAAAAEELLVLCQYEDVLGELRAQAYVLIHVGRLNILCARGRTPHRLEVPGSVGMEFQQPVCRDEAGIRVLHLEDGVLAPGARRRAQQQDRYPPAEPEPHRRASCNSNVCAVWMCVMAIASASAASAGWGSSSRLRSR